MTKRKKSQVLSTTAQVMAAAPSHSSGFDMKGYERQWAVLEGCNKKARKACTFVGRTVQFQVADGYAVYEVVRFTKTRAYLRHLPIGDAYRAADVEGMAVLCKDPENPKACLFGVPGRFIQERIRAEDTLGKLFAGRSTENVS